MIKNFISAVVVVATLFVATNSSAQPKVASSSDSVISAEQLNALKTKLSNLVGEASSIKPTPMVGLLEVIVDNRVFYSSYDGNYLIQGKLFDVEQRSDLTEETMSEIRVSGVEGFAQDMIVFPAKEEKHVISVFTDITCGYCRKMHEQIADYNDLGITVRYLAYPRYGIKDQLGQYSKGFKDLRSIWCHEDPKEALTKAKAGSTVAQRICDSPIEAEFNFGRQIGVSGTPAVIFENGFLLPGYKDPDSMLQILEMMKSAS